MQTLGINVKCYLLKLVCLPPRIFLNPRKLYHVYYPSIFPIQVKFSSNECQRQPGKGREASKKQILQNPPMREGK